MTSLQLRALLVSVCCVSVVTALLYRRASSACKTDPKGGVSFAGPLVVRLPSEINASEFKLRDNTPSVAVSDVLGVERPFPDEQGVHFIYQLPLSLARNEGVQAELLAHREREYVEAVMLTAQHPNVAAVHLLTELVHQQLRIYSLFPDSMHAKLRTFNLNKRMTYADAVLYANVKLNGLVVAISTADTSAIGPGWAKLTKTRMQNQLFGLTRHEKTGCAMTCDCTRHFDGCHDTFVFLSPLKGGDAFLEQISFRVGGLWGSENRFMWEAQAGDRALRISNPCYDVKMEHSHCVANGMFRPSQDQRRVNFERSMSPDPSHL